MKYLITLFTLSACGVWAANSGEDTTNVELRATAPEILGDEKVAKGAIADDAYSRPAYTDVGPPPDAPTTVRNPIPALILPNNVCIINTDLSPDRTIEEHILACVRAQRLRRSIRR